jgi:5-methylcytosine-specific restriction enzyme A
MTERKRRSNKERGRVFALRGGICSICNGAIQAGEKWEIEHRIPLEISRDDSDDNLDLAHSKCHKAKTKNDVKDIAKAKRRNERQKGIRRPKGQLKSAGFPKAEKVGKVEKMPMPKRARPLYVKVSE